MFNAPANAHALGCEVFQIFSRSPRGGPALALSKDIIEQFWSEMKKYEYSEFVIHTPYYINFGSKNKSISHTSARIIREELGRATLLGSPYVMTHMGSFKDLGRSAGLAQLVDGLFETLNTYRGNAQLLLEISAGAGEVMGGDFEQMAEILEHRKLRKFRLGVCFDTAHAFASGYDLRDASSVNKTLREFDLAIGLENLKVMHANDSKVGLGEKRDRHDHIGSGKIGKAGFRALLHHPKLKKVNMYLETEHDRVKEDIAILKELRGKS